MPRERRVMQLLPESKFRHIERLGDGTWIIRYGAVAVGRAASGEKMLTFGSSVFVERPAVQQVLRSLYRYAEAFSDDEKITMSLMNTDLRDYFRG